ncbi:hypothetical protein TRVL_07212 [Trypanosoma vivax]|nr:hypothetical protein TRVL_07212 [Trypanosoma vivax]
MVFYPCVPAPGLSAPRRLPESVRVERCAARYVSGTASASQPPPCRRARRRCASVPSTVRTCAVSLARVSGAVFAERCPVCGPACARVARPIAGTPRRWHGARTSACTACS